jgi:biopolymer transport protein ExbD
MNFRKRFADTSPGFQMAPMVDMMFQVLIVFMSATLFAQWENVVGITLPTADSGVRPVRHRELIINLDEKGAIFINSIERTPAELEKTMAQVADEFRDQPVIIRADRKTAHEHVILVLDICRKVDIRNVAFATLAPDEGAPTP